MRKKIKGYIYRYAVEMARVDGKPKQVWQKYLGTAEKIVELQQFPLSRPPYTLDLTYLTLTLNP